MTESNNYTSLNTLLYADVQVLIQESEDDLQSQYDILLSEFISFWHPNTIWKFQWLKSS